MESTEILGQEPHRARLVLDERVEPFRGGTEMTLADTAAAVRVVLRRRWWAVAMIGIILAFDIFNRGFMSWWSPRALAADVFSTGLAAALTFFLWSDISELRSELRWGPLSAYASRRIVGAALKSQQIAGAQLARQITLVATELFADGVHVPERATHEDVFAAGFDAAHRTLTALRNSHPEQELDDALSRWGALATTRPVNAKWLSSAAQLHLTLERAVALCENLDDIGARAEELFNSGTVDFRPQIMTTQHGLRLRTTGLPNELVEPFTAVGNEFGRRWRDVVDQARELRTAQRELQHAIGVSPAEVLRGRQQKHAP